jgi:hypothetical protein
MRKIREVRAELAQLEAEQMAFMREFRAKEKVLTDEIEAIQKSRGWVSKAKPDVYPSPYSREQPLPH